MAIYRLATILLWGLLLQSLTSRAEDFDIGPALRFLNLPFEQNRLPIEDFTISPDRRLIAVKLFRQDDAFSVLRMANGQVARTTQLRLGRLPTRPQDDRISTMSFLDSRWLQLEVHTDGGYFSNVFYDTSTHEYLTLEKLLLSGRETLLASRSFSPNHYAGKVLQADGKIVYRLWDFDFASKAVQVLSQFPDARIGEALLRTTNNKQGYDVWHGGRHFTRVAFTIPNSVEKRRSYVVFENGTARVGVLDIENGPVRVIGTDGLASDLSQDRKEIRVFRVTANGTRSESIAHYVLPSPVFGPLYRVAGGYAANIVSPRERGFLFLPETQDEKPVSTGFRWLTAPYFQVFHSRLENGILMAYGSHEGTPWYGEIQAVDIPGLEIPKVETVWFRGQRLVVEQSFMKRRYALVRMNKEEIGILDTYSDNELVNRLELLDSVYTVEINRTGMTLEYPDIGVRVLFRIASGRFTYALSQIFTPRKSENCALKATAT